MFGGCDYEPLLLELLHDVEGKVVHPTKARSLSSVFTQSLWLVFLTFFIITIAMWQVA
jgi:hypothetical protein